MKNQNQIKVFVQRLFGIAFHSGNCNDRGSGDGINTRSYRTDKRSRYGGFTGGICTSRFFKLFPEMMPFKYIQGTPLAINGTVKSDFSKITVLTVGVYNAAGEQVIGKTLSPNQVEYDLQNLNDALPFENLQAGTYQYRVTASNATNQNYIVINQSFVISSDPTVQVEATEDAIID